MLVCSSVVGKPVLTKGKYYYGVCDREVGLNSIIHSECNHWIHKKCSGLKKELKNMNSFKC